MLVTSDADFAARVRQIANHGGGQHKYDNVVPGTNSRLDALQAAVLRVKLRQLERWNAERRERVAAYDRALAGLPGITTPREAQGAHSAWHLYTIRVSDGRDALQARLAQRHIATAVHYPRPIHLQPAMASAGGRSGDLPVSEQLSREVLCLPLYPELPLEQLTRVAAEVRAFAETTQGARQA
jgi:dTDP-4-amino-4,6-dideoxygalactose transaminase